MTITALSLDALPGDRCVLGKWASDLTNPLFRIYVSGRLYTTTRRNNRLIPVGENELFNVEVRDDADQPANDHDTFVDVGWDAVAGAERYIVEEFVSAAWVLRTVIPETGLAVYSYRTAPLGDDTAATFRITPVGANGNAGTAVTIVPTVITQPDFEELTITFDDGTKKLTFVAA